MRFTITTLDYHNPWTTCLKEENFYDHYNPIDFVEVEFTESGGRLPVNKVPGALSELVQKDLWRLFAEGVNRESAKTRPRWITGLIIPYAAFVLFCVVAMNFVGKLWIAGAEVEGGLGGHLAQAVG